MLVIVQHLGGATAYFAKKPNPQHRSFGKVLVNIGRAIAAVGWILGGNVQNAIVVAIVSLVMTALAMIVGPSKKEGPQETEKSRSKSPRAKR